MRVGVLLLSLLSLLSCTEKTYITNPPVELPDSRPPTVEWVSLSTWRGELIPPSTAVSDTVTLTVSASDESGIDSVKVYVNGFARFSQSPPAIAGGVGGVVSFLWNTLSDSDGVYSLEARAWDKAGNVGETPALLVNVSNTTPPPPPDRTSPVIRWVAVGGEADSCPPHLPVRDTVTISFLVLDSSAIDSVKLYVNGEVASILAGQEDSLYSVTLDSWRYSNGEKVLDLRAWDNSGNIGASEPLGLTIDNHRVMWVPDDYEKIQDAINASVDGDTVRVRAGTYRGQTQFFDKNVSLVSEDGPEETVIDGTGYTYAAWISGGQDSSIIIRGFTFLNNGSAGDTWWNGLLIDGGASPKIVNNIFIAPMKNGIVSGQTFSPIRNNLFVNSVTSISIAHSWGDFLNNMIIHMSRHAFWNGAGAGQPLIPDYNLLWDFELLGNEFPMEWGEHNIIDVQPVFQLNSYRLQPGSPGIDQGDPSILDLNGTRSDIGVYGGPYAYR